MTIKNKLRAGLGFLFLMAFVCCGLSIWFLNRLSADAGVILKNNYESVKFVKNIGSALEKNETALDASQVSIIELNLVKQEHNVTEAGEQQLTDSLRSKYEQLKLSVNTPQKQILLRAQLRKVLYEIMQINMTGIEHKNAVANKTADSA